MKILVTGSSGMLGTEICAVLGKKHKIIGVDVNPVPSGVAGPEKFRNVDITDAASLKSVVSEGTPDILIHTAAWTDVDGCERDPRKAELLNVAGTKSVVGAAGSRNIPVIFISTDFVFDGAKKTPYTEKDVEKPISVYGRTKWEAEKAICGTLTRYLIVRTSWLYGKHGKNFVDTILAKAESGERLKVVNDQVGSPTYTRDLALAIDSLIDVREINSGDIFHVSNSGSCSWFELATRIVKETGLSGKAQISPISSAELGRPAPRPLFSVLDCAKFMAVSGRKIRSWDEALVDYLKGRRLKG